MIAGIICYSIIGLVIGVIFSLLFINFDKSWKKITSSLASIGGSGGLLVCANKFFGIEEQVMKFYTTSALYITFLFGFFFMMLLMCKLIKDKDDSDILRIRDIILGQKSYIDKYYEKRASEIDARLGIPILEERERKVNKRECSIEEKEQFIKQEQTKINRLGNKKLRMNLPEQNNIIITQHFLETLPSYIGDFSKCINNIKVSTESFIKDDEKDIEYLKAYLLAVATFIAQYIFGGNNDIRVHFRYYNESTSKFEKLISVEGTNVATKKMTPIPYEDSMIKKSFECKRCLIKSINSDYDYKSNNYTKWKDYMTFTFYNLKRNEMPYLTFGISVKNAARYQDVFYFLNFIELEVYLNEYIENIDQEMGFEGILYGTGDMCDE